MKRNINSCLNVFAALALLSSSALMAAELNLPASTSLQQIGSGSLYWFGFHVYDASTWALQGPLPLTGVAAPPFALQIIYARDISANDLVSATENAWDDLDMLDDKAKAWLPQLAGLWPDIKAGDCLVLYIDSAGLAQFYFNGAALGRIDDEQFASRFTAIWLHPNSSEPKLRKQLLGAAT